MSDQDKTSAHSKPSLMSLRGLAERDQAGSGHRDMLLSEYEIGLRDASIRKLEAEVEKLKNQLSESHRLRDDLVDASDARASIAYQQGISKGLSLAKDLANVGIDLRSLDVESLTFL